MGKDPWGFALIMADSRDLLSVGVDVGTTTTQIIFSRLNLQDVSRPGQIPRINITDRKVIYQSPIVFTPLIDFETIDADRLNPAGPGNLTPFGAAPGTPPLGVQIGQDLNVYALRSQYAF